MISGRRVQALVLRYIYLLRNSWPRLLEQLYWPTMDVIVWGLVTLFFVEHSDWVARAAGVLLSAVLLWNVLFRAQLGMSVPFMEELFARNLGQLLASPLRVGELLCGLLIVSLLRTLLGMSVAVPLAILLYEISLFELGLPLLAFFTQLLIFGWSLGLVVCSLLLRFGLGMESMAWVLLFAFAPLSCIYYPVETLPSGARFLALLLPTAHVFEGMREVLFTGHWNAGSFWAATGLNAGYLILGSYCFLWSFRAAREQGLLLRSPE